MVYCLLKASFRFRSQYSSESRRESEPESLWGREQMAVKGGSCSVMALWDEWVLRLGQKKTHDWSTLIVPLPSINFYDTHRCRRLVRIIQCHASPEGFAGVLVSTGSRHENKPHLAQ